MAPRRSRWEEEAACDGLGPVASLQLFPTTGTLVRLTSTVAASVTGGYEDVLVRLLVLWGGKKRIVVSAGYLVAGSTIEVDNSPGAWTGEGSVFSGSYFALLSPCIPVLDFWVVLAVVRAHGCGFVWGSLLVCLLVCSLMLFPRLPLFQHIPRLAYHVPFTLRLFDHYSQTARGR